MTGVRGAQPLLLTWADPATLACPHWPLEALLTPDPACALAIDRPAFAQQDLVCCLPTPAGMLSTDLAQASRQTLLLGAWRPSRLALRGTVLTDDAARTTL
jgi:hypothetical protein